MTAVAYVSLALSSVWVACRVLQACAFAYVRLSIWRFERGRACE